MATWVLILIGAMNNGSGNPPSEQVSVIGTGFASWEQCAATIRGAADGAGLACVRDDNTLLTVPYIAAELADAKRGWK